NLGSGTRHEIWAYGVRNPSRFSFDRATRDLYIGDVGQNAWEEVDFRASSSKGGENYGWPVFEGSHVYRSGVRLTGDVKPVAEYSHAGGSCSVTGGYVYRGSKIPSMFGFYVFADYCSGVLRRIGGEMWEFGAQTCVAPPPSAWWHSSFRPFRIPPCQRTRPMRLPVRGSSPQRAGAAGCCSDR